MKKLLIALAGVSALAVPAAANAQAVITPGVIAPIPGNNDFQTDLANLGFTLYTSTGADITLLAPSTLTFEFLGSESLLNDTFTAGSVSATEFTTLINRFSSPIPLGSDTFGAGTLAGDLFFSGGVPSPITVGAPGFAIFLGPNLQPAGTPTNVFYIGYDDIITGDDNHDDFIVRVTVAQVPEPATWAMMLTGFAAAGIALRRRRRTAQLPQLA